MTIWIAAVAGITPLAASTAVVDRGAPIDGILAAYRAAWAHADGAALAELFEPNAELNSLGGNAQGRGPIAELYAAAFAGGMAGSRLTIRMDGWRPVAPQLATARGTWTITPAAAAGAAPGPFCGRFFGVLRKSAGTWRIVVFDEVQLACDAVTP